MMGLIITILWLLIMIFIFSQKTSFNEISINELGDFLAGFFSPVAFLWLILGYIQQGHELQQNTLALTQQKNEYIKSIKLSAYIALMQYELNEVNFLNGLGKDFEKGAKKARERSKVYKIEIENLIEDIKYLK